LWSIIRFEFKNGAAATDSALPTLKLSLQIFGKKAAVRYGKEQSRMTAPSADGANPTEKIGRRE